ncbi:MAG: ATP synthase F1 subunit delta [Kiritimatiellia bacterium]|nr:ATP synthase F1 subunit delta [Kiritimatiellia bacterium]
MPTAELAKRYAKALMAVASKENTAERAAEEIRVVGRLCAGGSDLTACLTSPIVAVPRKKAIIVGLFSAKALALTVDFLCLLLEKHRLKLLSAVSEALDELLREKEGIARVSVASARPVNARDGDYLKRRLEQWLGRKVQLLVEHNPLLLSGIQIRVGDRFFDGSGLGRLAQVRAALENC